MQNLGVTWIWKKYSTIYSPLSIPVLYKMFVIVEVSWLTIEKKEIACPALSPWNYINKLFITISSVVPFLFSFIRSSKCYESNVFAFAICVICTSDISWFLKCQIYHLYQYVLEGIQKLSFYYLWVMPKKEKISIMHSIKFLKYVKIQQF